MQVDSKLFFGAQLGTFETVVPKLLSLFDKPPREYLNHIDQVNWLNTQLPKGLWLEVTYPHFSCPVSEMQVHFNLIDDDNQFTPKEMKKIIKNANYSGYSYYMGKLNINYTEPMFYTKYYIYN